MKLLLASIIPYLSFGKNQHTLVWIIPMFYKESSVLDRRSRVEDWNFKGY